MKVTFDLSDRDLKYFRSVMRNVRQKHADTTEAEIIAACRGLIDGIAKTNSPDFVTARVQKLEILINMLEDTQWGLTKRDRDRVVRGMAYFAEPDDMIPDKVPVLGFLDDAIMVELVVEELAPEIEAYADFCVFRDRRSAGAKKNEDAASREAWIGSRRQALHARMRRRRSRRRGRGGAGGGRTTSLW